MTGVGRLTRGPRAGALPPTEPCERCGAVSWRMERAGLWWGALTWLGDGGHWRPERAVCESCGLQGGSGGWSLVFVGGDPRRWNPAAARGTGGPSGGRLDGGHPRRALADVQLEVADLDRYTPFG